MAQLPEHFTPSSADSAGQPWAGRSFEANPFANDDGSTPPDVAAAFAAFSRGDSDAAAVVDALRDSRVLIPLIAELGEAGQNEAGVTVDKSADLSIVTVEGPDGRTVLPLFTSAAAMRAWNPSARPVPSYFRQAALAAADEHTDLIIVDPGSDTEFGLRRPAVWAVAQGHPWRPADQDPQVAAALGDGVVDEAAIERIEVAALAKAGSLVGPEVHITIVMTPHTDPAMARDTVRRVSERWQSSSDVLACVDSLSISMASAESTSPAPAASPEPSSRSRRGVREWFSRRRADRG